MNRNNTLIGARSTIFQLNLMDQMQCQSGSIWFPQISSPQLKLKTRQLNLTHILVSYKFCNLAKQVSGLGELTHLRRSCSFNLYYIFIIVQSKWINYTHFFIII